MKKSILFLLLEFINLISLDYHTLKESINLDETLSQNNNNYFDRYSFESQVIL
jgi:hypothetical protein